MLDKDALPGRQKVEELVAERLFREGLVDGPKEPYRGADPQTKPVKKKKARPAKIDEAAAKPATAPAEEPERIEADPRLACVSCGTRNDPDAVFCKKCGAKQSTDESEGDEAHADEKHADERGAS
jgi:hypothetical protein